MEFYKYFKINKFLKMKQFNRILIFFSFCFSMNIFCNFLLCYKINKLIQKLDKDNK